jgi:hypothetical protein
MPPRRLPTALLAFDGFWPGGGTAVFMTAAASGALECYAERLSVPINAAIHCPAPVQGLQPTVESVLGNRLRETYSPCQLFCFDKRRATGTRTGDVAARLWLIIEEHPCLCQRSGCGNILKTGSSSHNLN